MSLSARHAAKASRKFGLVNDHKIVFGW